MYRPVEERSPMISSFVVAEAFQRPDLLFLLRVSIASSRNAMGPLGRISLKRLYREHKMHESKGAASDAHDRRRGTRLMTLGTKLDGRGLRFFSRFLASI